MSLYLGNEIFEMDKQRIMDFNHLYIRQGSALQAQSIFGEKLIFRPHSTETLTHRKMTMNMAEKTNKAQKVRILANVGDNPDTQKKAN
jgi:RNA polymerase-associated protein LEO1